MQSKITRRSFDLLTRIQRNLPPFIEGHRGVNCEQYENTLLSFQKAIDYKLDSIELDVWLTSDKIPVVVHGGEHGELEDNTNGKGIISSTTFNALSILHTKKQDQPIPTLEEVFIFCKDKIFINIEIKDPLIGETFEQVIKLIEKHQMQSQIAISSFIHGYYDVIKNYARGEEMIEFGFLYLDEYVTKGITINWNIPNVSINLWQKDITPELVNKAHMNGTPVHCWFMMDDIENEEVYGRLFDSQVDVICCNQPNKAIEYREKYFGNHNSIQVTM